MSAAVVGQVEVTVPAGVVGVAEPAKAEVPVVARVVGPTEAAEPAGAVAQAGITVWGGPTGLAEAAEPTGPVGRPEAAVPTGPVDR